MMKQTFGDGTTQSVLVDTALDFSSSHVSALCHDRDDIGLGMISDATTLIIEDMRARIAQDRVRRLEQETSQTKLIGKSTTSTEQTSFMTQLLSNIVFKGFAIVISLDRHVLI